MTTCRSVQLIGALYLLLGVIGLVEDTLSASGLYFFIHFLIGTWAVFASKYRITAVRFARKAAVFFSILALIEGHLPSSVQVDLWPAVANDILVIHITTALGTAYYGYYWTDAAVEVHHNKAATDLIKEATVKRA